MRAAYLLESPLRRPALVGATALACTLAAVAVSRFLPPRYRAAALVGVEAGSASAASTLVVAPELLRRAESDLAARASAGPAVAPGDITPERLAAGLRVRSLSTTSHWIEFVHRDPATAALVANAVARLLVAQSGPPERAELLRAAPVPAEPESPSTGLVLVVGALAGLALGLGIAAAVELRDDTVKGPEDLAVVLPVPVLATIPRLGGAPRDPSD